MADRVELAFREAAGRLVPRGSRLLVAVSGGGDSVALLHLLVGRAARDEWTIAVAHLDHGLVPGAQAVRRDVERRSRDLGLVCIAERREVSGLRRRDESPEEAARRVRRGFLFEAAASQRCDLVVTGHTIDDQAETILMRLVRGAGATALTGIAERGPGKFVRPLLGIERQALRGYLARRKISFRDDPSNADLRHDRNRVRHRLLPALAEQLNPKAGRQLVQAALRFREDALFLDALARDEADAHGSFDSSGRLVLDAGRLATLAAPMAGRCARLALQRAGADARRIGRAHVEALLDLARGADGRQCRLTGGLLARRERRRLVLEPPSDTGCV